MNGQFFNEYTKDRIYVREYHLISSYSVQHHQLDTTMGLSQYQNDVALFIIAQSPKILLHIIITGCPIYNVGPLPVQVLICTYVSHVYIMSVIVCIIVQYMYNVYTI